MIAGFAAHHIVYTITTSTAKCCNVRILQHSAVYVNYKEAQMEIFSKRLREARIAKNLSQEQIATMLNIKQQSYTRYETGKGEPSLEMLVEICKILDESPEYLLGLTD